MQRIHRETLQLPDSNRLLVVAMHHAGTLAQHIHRTRARTTGSQDVRLKNGPRRAFQIPARYLFDKPRDIDVGRARASAGGIEAVQTSTRLNNRRAMTERRMQVRKTSNYIRVIGCLRQKIEWFTHRRLAISCPYRVFSKQSNRNVWLAHHSKP
jgi:hypothetical protein